MSRHVYRIAVLTFLIAGMLGLSRLNQAEAARKYTVMPVADTTIWAGERTQNFGKEPYLFLTYDAPPNNRHEASILLRFDVSSIQLNPGEGVTSAELRLEQVPRRGWGKDYIYARGYIDGFSEMSQTWANTPVVFLNGRNTVSDVRSPLVEVPAPAFFGRTVTFDAKTIIQRALERGERSVDIIVFGGVTDPCGCDIALVFYSRESQNEFNPDVQDLYSLGVGKRPTLTIGVGTVPGARK